MKFTKLFLPIFLLLTVFLSSSCFDILEEITLNDDGSGSLVYKVDMAELGSFMSSMGEGDDAPDMGELDALFSDNELVMGLESMEGISNVKNLSNKETYLFGFSLDFDEVEDLNEVLSNSNFLGAMMGGEDAEMDTENPGRIVSIKGKKVQLDGNLSVDQSELSGEDEMSSQMMMSIMDEAMYKTVYHFERDVKKVKKNERAIVGADGKSVVIEASMAQLLKGDANLNGQIKLK